MTTQLAQIGRIEPITEARAPEGVEAEHFTDSLEIYIGDILGIITILAALFFIVHAFLAAFQWVTSGGDSGKVTKARDRLTWSTLGLILIVATYSILGLIGGLIGFSILEVGEMIEKVSPPKP
jgi:hypothetical protein